MLPKRESWQLQAAKSRLSEVVDRAQQEGPQVITRHGREAAVLLSFEAYQALTRPKEDLVTFFHRSPLAGLALELERSSDTGREIEL